VIAGGTIGRYDARHAAAAAPITAANHARASGSPVQRAGPIGEPRNKKMPRPSRRRAAMGSDPRRPTVSPPRTARTDEKSRTPAGTGQTRSTYAGRGPVPQGSQGGSIARPKAARRSSRWSAKAEAPPKPAADSKTTTVPSMTRAVSEASHPTAPGTARSRDPAREPETGSAT